MARGGVCSRVSLPYGAVLALGGLAANAGAWTDTSVLVTNVRNFPNQRGTIVGARMFLPTF